MNNNSFKVVGGNLLHGEVIPQGAKNEALQIICAALLTRENVKINNIPNILDIEALLETLRGLGAEIERNGNSCSIQAENINLDYIDSEEFQEMSGRLRGALMITGPMLGRFGRAIVPNPGGDKIGIRPIDEHLRGLEKLGAQFEQENGTFKIHAKKLKGAYILMEEISVTGTANIIMASVLAEGTTTIFNAACEPYIKQLCKMLISMGARIEGIGTNQLVIEGVQELSGCEHTILPDMVEIGSWIGLAAMVGNGITIKDAHYEELGIIPEIFKKLGLTLERRGEDLFIPKHEHYTIQKRLDGNILSIYDAPWPGFTPDLMSILIVLATQADGSILIHQKMFESRLFFTDRLVSMGAQIILCDPHRAVVIGLNRSKALRPTKMASPDIRAGMALLIAALSADGESLIQNIDQIDRGYEKIEERLRALGANISRI